MGILNYWVSDSIIIGIVVVVLAVIIALSFHFKLKSVFSNYIPRLNKMFSKESPITDTEDLFEEDIENSTGELRLIGVDERTAAIIIATVTDHLKIPLNELQFNSIKLLD